MNELRRIGGMPRITLFHAEWCEFSAMVRKGLAAAGAHYDAHEVPMDRNLRHDLEAATGQLGIPALLIDGEVVVGMPRIMRVVAGLTYGATGGDDQSISA